MPCMQDVKHTREYKHVCYEENKLITNIFQIQYSHFEVKYHNGFVHMNFELKGLILFL